MSRPLHDLSSFVPSTEKPKQSPITYTSFKVNIGVLFLPIMTEATLPLSIDELKASVDATLDVAHAALRKLNHQVYTSPSSSPPFGLL